MQGFKQYIIRQLRHWHRQLGVISAIFLAWLIISGVLLNHTEQFSLAKLGVTNTWLLDHYQIKAPSKLVKFEHAPIVVTDNLVWLNHQLIAELSAPIIGANQTKSGILVIAQTNQLQLFDRQGQLIDQLDISAGLPTPISKLCQYQQNIVLQADDQLWQTDDNFFDWQILTPNQTQSLDCELFIPQQMISAESKPYIQAFRQHLLSLERVIYDLHSGRFFGDWGVWFVDAIALALLLLLFSGLYIWWRYHNSRRR